jgi:hypothetical protein
MDACEKELFFLPNLGSEKYGSNVEWYFAIGQN